MAKPSHPTAEKKKTAGHISRQTSKHLYERLRAAPTGIVTQQIKSTAEKRLAEWQRIQSSLESRHTTERLELREQHWNWIRVECERVENHHRQRMAQLIARQTVQKADQKDRFGLEKKRLMPQIARPTGRPMTHQENLWMCSMQPPDLNCHRLGVAAVMLTGRRSNGWVRLIKCIEQRMLEIVYAVELQAAHVPIASTIWFLLWLAKNRSISSGCNKGVLTRARLMPDWPDICLPGSETSPS